MKDSILNLIVDEKHSLQELLQKMDQGAKGILLVVDKHGQLQRTITDGDIRRLILSDMPLNAKNIQFGNKKPVTAKLDTSSVELLTLMKETGVNQIPIIDELGRPVKLISISDLNDRILLSTPHMGDLELDYVNEAFQTNWIAPLGPNVDAFENELVEKVKGGYGAALSSGTAAIHMGLVLLDVKPGDIVFCSSLTFIASANPIMYQGAVPVFIDSDLESWNMSPEALKRAFEDAVTTNRLPKAVVVVNLYGQSADMDPIKDICDMYNVPIIEDAAESLGATYKGRSSGSIGHLGVYSFNGNKIITTSGGGMLISDDAELIKKARHLATQARDPAPWYQHTEVGFNYRMSNVLAGIGRGQLKVLDSRVEQRRAIFDYYEASSLSTLIDWMPEADFGCSNRWLTVGLINQNVEHDVQTVIDNLSEKGIEARRVWKPLHLQPIFADCKYFAHSEDLSCSDLLFDKGICLPSGTQLNKFQLDRVISELEQACS